MSDEIKQAIEALKKCDQAFGIMSRSALHSGLEGTKEWDTIAGSADMYGAQDAAREAAVALGRLSGRVTVKADAIAREVYTAMLWAAKHRDAAYLPDWVPGGNSNAQDEARRAESRILAAIDTAPTPSPDQIRREALNIIKRKSAEARKYPGASVAVTYLDEVADAIEALITGGDDDAA